MRKYGSDQGLTASQSAGVNAPYNDSYSGRFEEDAFIFGLDNESVDADVVDGTDQFYVRFNGDAVNPMTTCAGDAVNDTDHAVDFLAVGGKLLDGFGSLLYALRQAGYRALDSPYDLLPIARKLVRAL